MNVELRHLRALVAIGEEGTLTDAARALHLTQPALSRTLAQLEQRLGVRLVERTTRSLHLTEPGRRLWEDAHRLLALLDDALADATGRRAPRPLRLAFAWAALGSHTVPLLRTWRERHPEVPVEIRRADDPAALLRRGEADLAFLRVRPAGDDQRIQHRALTRERRMAAVPLGHALADRTDVALAELRGETVALCATAATTGADLWPAHARPRTVTVPGVDEWLTTIATGAAVGVTAEGTVHQHPHPGVRYLPVRDAEPVTVHLAWPAVEVHPSAAAFREHIAHHLTERNPGAGA
ncbi:LysR family transcriptional regulator [Streptomyces sp. XM83C]|jgi:DNA-binding transcriptional LysR family regulator|uniref:LysR family transcriptional regulator n=1 Tax=Streptomyces thermocoprophilus TaxID=78356 RepID=A0ABV5VJS0_9ACTN|nr:LysR family transcriptional regulator [Streptomyces sp. XM83C]MCK1820330.1 LysR family transcriptional regulator [Streptomyces sp. XM83C]